MIDYGFVKNIADDFESVENKVIHELNIEGFGVLTKIDIQEKFEENIGLMLPCNIIIYQKDDTVTIGIIKPSLAMGMINNPGLSRIAQSIEQKLKSVFDKI